MIILKDWNNLTTQKSVHDQKNIYHCEIFISLCSEHQKVPTTNNYLSM